MRIADGPSFVRVMTVSVLLATATPALHSAVCADEAIDIGSRRELFADRFLIERMASRSAS